MTQSIPVFELLPESQKEAGIFRLAGYSSAVEAHTLLRRSIADPSDGGTRTSLSSSGYRSLRDDRNSVPRDKQSIAPWQAQARVRGYPGGPEVKVMDEEGNLLPAGMAGEVVIRGDNVMRGYEDNAVANRAAFRNGWFRSGDQGYLEADGYLYITGRIKEIINRGGEKISPREVEEVLLEHPEVAEAVAFAVPHASLGEDIVAAVTFTKGALPQTLDLRPFLADRLAEFKVPRRIFVLSEIPKGPSGKVQRSDLAERFELGLRSSSDERPQEPPQQSQGFLYQTVAKIWRDGRPRRYHPGKENSDYKEG